jgi:hypothetical protein
MRSIDRVTEKDVPKGEYLKVKIISIPKLGRMDRYDEVPPFLIPVKLPNKKEKLLKAREHYRRDLIRDLTANLENWVGKYLILTVKRDMPSIDRDTGEPCKIHFIDIRTATKDDFPRSKVDNLLTKYLS